MIQFLLVCALTNQVPAPLERLETVKGTVLVKLDKLRSEKATPTREQFANELTALEQIASASMPANADAVIGALVFEADLLGRQLGDGTAAVRCYDRLLELRDLDPYTRKHALVEKATLLCHAHRVTDLEAMVTAYASAADHDPELGKHLAAMLRRARLQPGAPFPRTSGRDLADQPFATPAPEARLCVVAFVRMRDEQDLRELRTLEPAIARAAGATLLVVSIDLDREAVLKAYQGRDLTGVVWQQGDNSLATTCGVLETPAFFALDPNGKIVAEVDSASRVVDALNRPIGR